MRKKLVSMMLCATMVLSMALTGCGSSQEKDTAATGDVAATETGATNETGTDAEVEFTWMHHMTEDGKRQWVEWCAKTYMEKHPNVTINVEMVSQSDYDQMLKTKIAADDAPMIFDMERTSLAQYKDAGHLADINDVAAGLTDYDESTLLEGQFNDTQYGIPVDMNGYGVFYNKDVFEENNIEIPKTLSELKAVCETLQEKGITPFGAPFSESWCTIQYISVPNYIISISKDKNWFVDKMNLSSSFADDAGFKEAMQILKDFAPYYGDDPFATTWNDTLSGLATGEVAMTVNGSYTIAGVTSINPDARIGAFAFPTSEDPSGAVVVMKPGSSFCVYNSSDADKVAAAKGFLSFLTSEEAAAQFVELTSGITAHRVDTKTVEGIDDINAYTGDSVYVNAAVTEFSMEYLVAEYEQIVSYLMGGIADTDELAKKLDEAFATIE